MKYTITMGCGHEDTVRIFGSSSEREHKIKYLQAYGICKECYKKSMIENEENTPEFLRGHIWNQKIYGKPGKYFLYLNGDKLEISDEEADEARVYIQEKNRKREDKNA